MGIQEDFIPIIAMDNELLLDRLVLTPNKKSYAGSIVQQEGNTYENPKIDVKGLAIRKVSTNKTVREYYSNILDNYILDEKEIDLMKIISKYKELEIIIKESLLKGEIDFTIPSKANSAENYVNPYSQQPYRAVLTWNKLFPELDINLPNKINMVKLNIKDMDDVRTKIEDPDIIARYESIFENKDLTKNGINVVAIGEVNEIPEEIRPFIDIEAMVGTHTKPGLPLLKSLGFETLTSTESEFTTNIIRF